MAFKDLICKLIGTRTETRTYAPRAPRVKINFLHRVEFYPKAPWALESMWIANISSSGLGLMLPPGFQLPDDRTSISGDIKIDGERFPVTMRLVHESEGFIGGSYENPSYELTQALQKYFDAELTALKLKSVPTEYLKKPAAGESHWFQGANSCELSFVSDGDSIRTFGITIFGNHLEGGIGLPLRYSEVSVSEEKGKASFKGTDLLNQMRTPDKDFLTLAVRMLRAIEGLSPSHREAIEEELKKSS